MKPKNDNKLDELELKVKQLQGQKTFLIILMFLLISSNIIMYFKQDLCTSWHNMGINIGTKKPYKLIINKITLDIYKEAQ